MAIKRLSKAATPSSSKAKRKVAWYKSALDHCCLKTYEPPQPLTWLHAAHQCQVHYTGSTAARPANPNKNQTQLTAHWQKLPPMERSGTTIMACLTPWLLSLSNAINISARDLPDAGGDLINKYCSPRLAKARSWMVRMPSALRGA